MEIAAECSDPIWNQSMEGTFTFFNAYSVFCLDLKSLPRFVIYLAPICNLFAPIWNFFTPIWNPLSGSYL